MYQPKRVALILPKGHEYAAKLIEGVVGFLQDHDGFEIIEVPYDEGRTPSVAYAPDVDAAMIWTDRNCPWVLDLRDRGVVLVSANSEWCDEGIPAVSVTLEDLLNRIVEHFRGLGREHAAFLGHGMSQSPIGKRFCDAFLDRCRQEGWTAVALDVPGIPNEERQRLGRPEGERELIDFLRGLPRPTSIFCDDDYVGVLACRVAAHVGLAVPDDLAVLGSFDLAVARFSTPTLSSIPTPGQAVGAAAMRLISEMLAGARPAAMHLAVPAPPVVQRESTGGITIRDDDIRRAHRMIEQHACEGLAVEDLLERLAISKKTLNKRFLAVYGRTPGEEIRRIRAERAKHWLATTSLTIGRIASMCGFGEASTFNRFFKSEVGSTPSEYRKQLQ